MDANREVPPRLESDLLPGVWLPLVTVINIAKYNLLKHKVSMKVCGNGFMFSFP